MGSISYQSMDLWSDFWEDDGPEIPGWSWLARCVRTEHAKALATRPGEKENEKWEWHLPHN